MSNCPIHGAGPAQSSCLSGSRVRGWRLLALVIGVALITPLRGQQFEGFRYSVEYAEDNSPFIRISQYTGPGGSVIIPRSITVSIQGALVDVPVHRLSSTFLGNASVTHVTIPEGVRSIGTWTFAHCRGLTSIVIPNSVTSIGVEAFQSCSELTEISIPGSVTSIGRGAFASCSKAARVAIGDGVTTIGQSAFSGCSALSALTLGENVSTIESSAFSGCYQLDLISLPAGVTTIQSRAFYQCGPNVVFAGDAPTTLGSQAFPDHTGLRIFYHRHRTGFSSPTWQGYRAIGIDGFHDGFAFTRDGEGISIVGYRRSTRVLTIPDTVEGLPVRSIGAGAFSGNLTLASVELPDGVTTIGESAFSGCTSLTRLHLGPRLTSIGNQAFQGCQGLTSLRLSPSLTSIGSSAFSGCSGLTGLVVPERVATVGANAFSGCTGLGHALLEGDAPDAFDVDGAAPGFSVFFRKDRTGYTAPAWKGHRAVGIDGRHENLTYASDGVSLTINGFTGLGGRVVIPETIDGLPVREISGAFFERRDLTSVIVPAGVTSLSARAFFDCRSLSCLVFEGNAPHVSNSDVFPGASGRFTIYFHKESTGFDAPLWDPYRKLTIDGRDGDYTYSLDGGTATVNGYIGPGGSVTIPDNIRGVPVTRMENQLFMWNLRVTDVSIPDSVTSIGSRAFQECENLTRVTIGNGVTSIGFWAFANCWNLTELTIGTSVRFIDYWAFADCRRLFRVVIPDSVETISQGAFFECANLVDVMIGKGVTSIGDSAFSRSPDLIRATFAGNAPDTLGESIFSGASLSFTVNYSSESTGFTSPTWQGYASVALETPAPTPLQTWRWQHFGDQATNSGEAADSADPDGDGSTNLEEFAAGTDPKSVAGDFQILRTNLNGTTFIVTIRALPGRLYELQRLIPAADPSWHAVDTTGPIEAATAVMLIDPAAPSRDAIYRVVCKLLLL